MTTTWYPTVAYHPTKAPKGQLFTSEAAFLALNDEWVDTPTKFPVDVPVDPAVPVEVKRGRPRKVEQ